MIDRTALARHLRIVHGEIATDTMSETEREALHIKVHEEGCEECDDRRD